ncbi:MAG: DUF1810 domain-containing protein [Pseudoramibacter sp.]
MASSLNRFLTAQQRDYEKALAEIRGGHKQSHWIWYIFPQIRGLGFSAKSEFYGISDMAEAKAYLQNPTLRAHLIEISEALLSLDTKDARQVMGFPDDLKLRSSMTLFHLADPDIGVFQKVLDQYFHGEMDQQTIDILGLKEAESSTVEARQEAEEAQEEKTE